MCMRGGARGWAVVCARRVLDETLRLRLVTSQGKNRLVSYTPLAPGQRSFTSTCFDRAVDICRWRSCANCCSIPALAELDTALLRCSLSSTLQVLQVQHIHGSADTQRPPQRCNPSKRRRGSRAIRVEARRPPHRGLPRGALLLALEPCVYWCSPQQPRGPRASAACWRPWACSAARA